MEGDRELSQADGGTDVRNQYDEAPTVSAEAGSTEVSQKEPAAPKEQLRGFAATYASYLKYQEENPDFDLEAEKTRKREESRAAWVTQRQGKETYFFYGALMDPAIAQEILGLERPPAMRPAVLRNRGHLRMWGPLPAFVADQEPYVDLKGVVCDIEGADRKNRLAAYEGEKYYEITCLINPVRVDGSLEESIFSWVFKWIGGKVFALPQCYDYGSSHMWNLLQRPYSPITCRTWRTLRDPECM